MAKYLNISFWIEDGPEFCPLKVKRAALAPERACTKASAVKWVLGIAARNSKDLYFRRPCRA